MELESIGQMKKWGTISFTVLIVLARFLWALAR